MRYVSLAFTPLCATASLVHVARRLQDLGQGHNRGVQLQHVLLDDVVLSPRIQNVGLQGGTWWSVVVQTSDTYGVLSEDHVWE